MGGTTTTTSGGGGPSCESGIEGDVKVAACEEWCDPEMADDHCRMCKCHGCSMCAGVSLDAMRLESERAELLKDAHHVLHPDYDALSWPVAGKLVYVACDEGHAGDVAYVNTGWWAGAVRAVAQVSAASQPTARTELALWRLLRWCPPLDP